MNMSSMVISAILANIKEAFPQESVGAVQMVLTIPSLVGMLFAFIAGPLSMKIAKKSLILAGLFLGLVGGAFGFFFGPKSLLILFISSAFIGVNQGMNGSVTKAVVSDLFADRERDDMMGWQQAAATGGTIVLTFCAGLLSGISWRWSYFVLILFILMIVLVQKNLTFVAPDSAEKSPEAGNGGKLNGACVFVAVASFFSFLFLYSYQLNVSLYIQTSGLGNSVVAGYANTIFPLAGMLTAFLYGKIKQKLGNKIMQVGMITLAIGFLGIKFVGTLPAVFFASFCTGVAQAFIIPSAVLVVSRYAPPSVRATGISLTMGLLNLGMFVSPFIINNIAAAMGGDAVSIISSKYLISAIGMIILALVYTVFSPVFYKKREQGNEYSKA
jgi:MFS family permease